MNWILCRLLGCKYKPWKEVKRGNLTVSVSFCERCGHRSEVCTYGPIHFTCKEGE